MVTPFTWLRPFQFYTGKYKPISDDTFHNECIEDAILPSLLAQKAQQYGPKRALFQVTKEAGGGVDSTSMLPRNENQVKHIKKKQQDPGPANMELLKTTFCGFIHEIICNDLPIVMLFTDRQLDNTVKFYCQRRPNQLSELSVDLTFQLGLFYLLVQVTKTPLSK